MFILSLINHKICLSVGQLIDSGHFIMFDNKSCGIKDEKSDQVIVNVYMAPNKLFSLEVSSF